MRAAGRVNADRVRRLASAAVRRLSRALVWGLLVLAVSVFVYRLIPPLDVEAVDFPINWTAAYAAREGISVYSTTPLQALSAQHIGSSTYGTFTSTFLSYIGPPATAMLHMPYTWVGYGVAVAIHRVISGVLFAASVFIAG